MIWTSISEGAACRIGFVEFVEFVGFIELISAAVLLCCGVAVNTLFEVGGALLKLLGLLEFIGFVEFVGLLGLLEFLEST